MNSGALCKLCVQQSGVLRQCHTWIIRSTSPSDISPVQLSQIFGDVGSVVCTVPTRKLQIIIGQLQTILIFQQVLLFVQIKTHFILKQAVISDFNKCLYPSKKKTSNLAWGVKLYQILFLIQIKYINKMFIMKLFCSKILCILKVVIIKIHNV